MEKRSLNQYQERRPWRTRRKQGCRGERQEPGAQQITKSNNWEQWIGLSHVSHKWGKLPASLRTHPQDAWPPDPPGSPKS